MAPRLSLGAGFGLYEFAGSDEAQPLGGPTVIEVNLAMDASAWLRAYLPLRAVAELYLAAGVGPSLQNSLVRKDPSGDSTPPRLRSGWARACSPARTSWSPRTSAWCSSSALSII